MQHNAQHIVTAVRDYIDAFEGEDAPYIARWILESVDRRALLHAIARCLTRERYPRVARAINDALASYTALEPFDFAAAGHVPRCRRAVNAAKWPRTQ